MTSSTCRTRSLSRETVRSSSPGSDASAGSDSSGGVVMTADPYGLCGPNIECPEDATCADFDGMGMPVSQPHRMVKRTKVASPTTAIWLADGIERFNETAGQAPSWPPPTLADFFSGDPAAMAKAILTGHQDGLNTNVTYADGHAATVAPVIPVDSLDVVR